MEDHFKKLATFLDPKAVKTKASFSRAKAFLEAYKDASLAVSQVTKARGKIDSMVKNEEQQAKLYSVKLTPEGLIEQMVKVLGS